MDEILENPAIVFYKIKQSLAAEALHCVPDVTFMFNSGLKCFQIELRSVKINICGEIKDSSELSHRFEVFLILFKHY